MRKLLFLFYFKKIMVYFLVYRGGVFMKVFILYGGEYRNKLRCF